MPLYEYECSVCGEVFEEFRTVEKRNEVFCCGQRAQKYFCSNPQTDADLSYQFVTEIFGGTPIQIISRTHYRQLLKQHNMPDASPSECCKEAKMKKKGVREQTQTRRKKMAHRIHERFKKDNVNHVAREVMTKVLNGGRRNNNG